MNACHRLYHDLQPPLCAGVEGRACEEYEKTHNRVLVHCYCADFYITVSIVSFQVHTWL